MTRLQLARWGDTTRLVQDKQAEINQFQAVIDDIECIDESARHRIEQYGLAIECLQSGIDQAIRFKVAVDELIAELPPLAQAILTLRYIHGCSWEQVATRINYSLSQTKQIEHDALIKLSERCI